MWLRSGITVILYWTITLCGAESSGFYRCHWFGAGDDADDGVMIHNAATTGYVQTRMCFRSDSEKLTSYINHCTGQKYSPLRACHDNGTWNCDSFFGFCKSLVSSEPQIPEIQAQRQQVAPQLQHHEQQQQQQQQQNSQNSRQNQGAPPMCPPFSSYFSLKEMAVAVLVSFISGAALLTIFIIVIWRYRHTKWYHCESPALNTEPKVTKSHIQEQVTETSSKAFSSSPDIEPASAFMNPNYAQIIASNMVLEDVLSETDKVYEDIINNRKPSTRPVSTDCVYTKVANAKRKVFKTISDTSEMSNASGDVNTYNVNECFTDSEEPSKCNEQCSSKLQSCDSGYEEGTCDSMKEKVDLKCDAVDVNRSTQRDCNSVIYQNESRKMSFKF